ncbi:sugar phosphate isomerase/epimerase [bacterium]|nr:sugar phosphate isomerase/epimerase [bacterium]
MKLSIVLSTQPASFSALAYKGELEKNLAKIHALGYDGVELAVRDPALLNLDELRTLLSRHQLPVAAIGTGQAFGEDGLSLTHADDSVRRKAIQRLRSQLALAQSLNAVVIVGLLRGLCPDRSRIQAMERRLAVSLTVALRGFEQVRVVLEPINRYETPLLNTVASALGFLDRLGLDQVGLLLDTFHMNIEEPSLPDSIRMAGDRLFHFHLADSNRWHPGAGHIDFPVLVKTLEEIGYRNYLSAEILPMPNADAAAENTIRYMRRLVPAM